MKHLLFISLFISANACSQVLAEIGGGISVTKTQPAVELNFGYRNSENPDCPEKILPWYIVKAGVVALPGTSVENPTSFNIRAGRSFKIDDFTRAEIMAGYSNNFASYEQKQYNSRSGIYSITFVKNLGLGEMAITIGKVKDNIFGTMKLRYLFIKE